MEYAQTIKEIKIKDYDVKVEMIKWPLSTLRLTGTNDEEVVRLSTYILNKWIQYSDEGLDIVAFTNGERHNTITPIARMKDNQYQIDLVLRNNRTSEQYPDGIFHPHQEHHHIKKENIGLIEVMGLAILPARLKNELADLKECLLGKKNIEDFDALKKHIEWYEYLKTISIDEKNIDKILEQETVKKFVSVLENAGVYKMNEEGINGFTRFVEYLNE